MENGLKSGPATVPPEKSPAKAGRTAGRPRAFDPEAALDDAMRIFWRNGYEGASLSDLTKAMGINRPSLYATFGDKEELFRKVVERYSNGPGSYIGAALALPTARQAIEALLLGAVDSNTCPEYPAGCLMIKGFSTATEHLRCELTARHQLSVDAIRDRLLRGQREGDLSPAVDIAVFTRFIDTIVGGIAYQATGGATRQQLYAVVQTAMQAWPE